MILKKYIPFICLTFLSMSFYAQETDIEINKEGFFQENMDYQIRAQFSIGGNSPLGMPREIREIESYNPTMQLGLGVSATKWFSDKKDWGLRLGLRLEGRGMKTKAKVKNYLIDVSTDQGPSRGYFTGTVQTTSKNSYLTFPVLATYNVAEKWNIYGGLYFSALIDKNFSGYVYDGYLREDTPIGNKVEFNDDGRGDYDYSKDLNNFQWGVQVGGEWAMDKHFILFSDLTWGANKFFKKDFEAIAFDMYSIYLNLGFAYKF